MAFHLNKGWYNELVRSSLSTPGIANIGTNTDATYARGRSVAWNIIQSYYAIYEYVNSIVFTNTAHMRTEEHQKSTRLQHVPAR